MNYARRMTRAAALFALAGLTACASLPENLIAKPEVELRDVQILGLGFRNQTFLLSFDISNPNPFPLPVNHVSYGVELDGQRFASGETTSSFTVPAGSGSEFSISVDLNLLQTAPDLLFIVRDAARRDVPYALSGEFGIDLPYVRPVRFENDGVIRLTAATF